MLTLTKAVTVGQFSALKLPQSGSILRAQYQRWANETGLDVTACHYPPGTSKWNKIEHRLFSHITMNWRGRPLVSYQVIVNLIGATTTQAGLRVQADLDTDVYPTKVKVTDKQLATVDLHPHRFHGEWNYTIKQQIISV